jgi:hypothetical protein
MTSTTIATVLQFFQKATEYDRCWYKAWHSWAYMNFQALLEHKQLTTNALDGNRHFESRGHFSAHSKPLKTFGQFGHLSSICVVASTLI